MESEFRKRDDDDREEEGEDSSGGTNAGHEGSETDEAERGDVVIGVGGEEDDAQEEEVLVIEEVDGAAAAFNDRSLPECAKITLRSVTEKALSRDLAECSLREGDGSSKTGIYSDSEAEAEGGASASGVGAAPSNFQANAGQKLTLLLNENYIPSPWSPATAAAVAVAAGTRSGLGSGSGAAVNFDSASGGAGAGAGAGVLPRFNLSPLNGIRPRTRANHSPSNVVGTSGPASGVRSSSPPPPIKIGPSPSSPSSDNAAASSSASASRDATQTKHGLGDMYNWQATKGTTRERLTFMFNNDLLADVYFIVGKDSSQQRIPAHKFILSIGSAVFDAMFNSSFPSDETEIVLPDVEPASFLALLRFLYTDDVQIGPETVMTTLYTAKKYAVPSLEQHCVDFLKHNLSADNAFMLLTQARLFDEPQLAALCLETIDKYTQEALNAEGFADIDIETLSSVLDRDSLRIKESKLFAALLRWAEAECLRQNMPTVADDKRMVLGKVLNKIRFPLMSVEEFAQGPAQSGILTDKETVSLFLYFTVNPKPTVAFLDVPRCSMTGKEQTVNRFQQIESRWGYSGTSDKIRFIVDRRIFVVGFGLYGSIHGPFEYQVVVQLSHTGSGRILGSNDCTYLSDGTNATFRVMFKEPMEIMPNTNYTATATIKGLDSHYGTKGLRKVWVDCPQGGAGKVTFQFSYAAGNNNGTSVEDGQIPEIIFYT